MTDWSTADLRLFRGLASSGSTSCSTMNLHLLRRDVDFPGVMANSDISQRLRSAAHYRRIRIALTFMPDGIFVQANREPGEVEGTMAEQLFLALEQKGDH